MVTPLERLLEIASLIGACALLVTAFRLAPDDRGYGTHEQLGLEPCGYFESTGRPCFACGMTTSFAHMAALQPRSAFRANPAGALLFLLVAFAPFWIVWSWRRRLPALRFLAQGRAGWWLAGSAIAVALSWTYKSGQLP